MLAAKFLLWLLFMAVPCIIRYSSIEPRQRDFGRWWNSEGIVLCMVTGLVSGAILAAL